MINLQDFSKMNKFNTHIALLIIAILSTSICFSQSRKKADKLFKNKAYVEAAAMYSELPKDQTVLQNLGDAYYYNLEMIKAANTYKQLVKTYKDSINRDYFFRYSHALRGIKAYKESDSILNLYLNDTIDTDQFRNRINTITPYLYTLEKVTNNSEGTNFGGSFRNGNLVFASTQNFKNPEYKWNEKPYLDLYEAQIIDGKIDSIVPFSEKINTKLHESNAVFTKDGSTMYFSRTNDKRVVIDSQKVATVRLFKATLEDEEWTNVEPLPFSSDLYSTQHPSLNDDESRLYFASDMPGTLGAFDIFYVDINEDGSYGEPVNVGAVINTERKEQFPFIAQDSVLYFSSDGHYGFGGLDIFSSKMKKGTFLSPINAGETINHENDDFGFVQKDTTDTGFVSLYRDGSDQIYSFVREKNERSYVIEGFVTDKKTKEILPNSTVTLFDEDNNQISQVTTDSTGHYELKIKPNRTYSIEGYRPFYVPSSTTFDTTDSGDLDFNIELEIQAFQDAEDIIVKKDDGYIYVELENIYFDLDKWDIKPEAERTLDVLVDVLYKYPRMEVQLGAHTDSRSSEAYNLQLSENRAKATLEYIVSKGIDRSRLTSKGYGESRPLVDCGNDCTEEEYSINRRCEFLITK